MRPAAAGQTSALLLRDAATNTVSEDAPPSQALLFTEERDAQESPYEAGAQALAAQLRAAEEARRLAEEPGCESDGSSDEERLDREPKTSGLRGEEELADDTSRPPCAASSDDEAAFEELYARHGLVALVPAGDVKKSSREATVPASRKARDSAPP